jgi:putative oxidoreductase
MSLFSSPSKRQVDIGLAILRVAVGAVFVAHGGQKLFVYGFEGVAGAFGQMGIPMASVLGPFVGFVELFGGLALITGLLTRVAALGLLSTMAVAILKVHLPAGFFAPQGVEFPLSLLAANALLAIAGAGSYSLDRLIGERSAKPTEGRRKMDLRKAA